MSEITVGSLTRKDIERLEIEYGVTVEYARKRDGETVCMATVSDGRTLKTVKMPMWADLMDFIAIAV